MPFYVFFINIEKSINDSSSRVQTITIPFTSPLGIFNKSNHVLSKT